EFQGPGLVEIRDLSGRECRVLRQGRARNGNGDADNGKVSDYRETLLVHVIPLRYSIPSQGSPHSNNSRRNRFHACDGRRVFVGARGFDSTRNSDGIIPEKQRSPPKIPQWTLPKEVVFGDSHPLMLTTSGMS